MTSLERAVENAMEYLRSVGLALPKNSVRVASPQQPEPKPKAKPKPKPKVKPKRTPRVARQPEPPTEPPFDTFDTFDTAPVYAPTPERKARFQEEVQKALAETRATCDAWLTGKPVPKKPKPNQPLAWRRRRKQ